MRLSTLKIVVCPQCEHSLDYRVPDGQSDINLRYGVVSCRCGFYPIISGILQYRPGGYSEEEIKDFIIDDPVKALSLQLYRELRIRACYSRKFLVLQNVKWKFLKGHRKKLVQEYIESKNRPLFELIGHWGNREWENYLKFRPSSPTHIVLLHLLHHLPRCSTLSPFILDLCSGLGHFSSIIQHFLPNKRIVCVDISFINHYFNSRYMTPEADYVLLDANFPMPFIDRAFSFVFHIDAFHYIRNKPILSNEIVRIVENQGLSLLVHLHNSIMDHVSPGMPLKPHEYQKLFSRKETRIYDEEELYCALAKGNEINFECTAPSQRVNNIKEMMMIVGSVDFSLGEGISTTKPIPPQGSLYLNPLYMINKDNEVYHLRRKFPSRSFRKEYEILVDYLPKELEIKREDWEHLAVRLSQHGAIRKVRSYMNRGILVVTPESYFNPSWPSMRISAKNS